MKNFDFELLPIYFHNFKKYIDKTINESLKEYDLNCMHFKPIILLSKLGSLSLNELTNKLGIDKANTTRVIQDLLDKKIVYKTDDKVRGYKIKLTDIGNDIALHVSKHHDELHKKIFMGFTEEEQNQLFNLMIKYFNNIKNIEEEQNEENI